MIENRRNSRAIGLPAALDERAVSAARKAHWNRKREDAERGAPLLAAMEAAGVNSLQALQALQGAR